MRTELTTPARCLGAGSPGAAVAELPTAQPWKASHSCTLHSEPVWKVLAAESIPGQKEE